MKRYLLSALAALVLVIAAPSAFAAARHVIFDPLPPGTQCGSDCQIWHLGETYQTPFVDCTPPGPQANFPGGPIASAQNKFPGFTPTYCLWLNNISGTGGNTFQFDLIFPTGMSGDTLDCDWSGPVQASNNCSLDPVSGDSILSMVFHTNPLFVDDGNDFYLLTDFPISPELANVTMTVSVPEPGELGLFGLGLLAIGVGYGLQRRRQKLRAAA